MLVSLRITAILFFAALLNACAARTVSSFVPGSIVAPHHHVLDAVVRPVDLGRRAANKRVAVVVQLRYNHQAELDRFLDRLARTPHPRYLSREEFMARYAPTPQQEERVIQLLRANGFSIDQVYSNRTTIDVSAPAARVERLFNTEIHDFRQGRFGFRVANVKPLRVPAMLAPYVLVADANSLVLKHPFLQFDTEDVPGATLPAIQVPDEETPAETPDATNLVRNPGFEKGKLSPWLTCRQKSSSPTAAVTKNHPHGGRFDAYAGTFSGHSEPQGVDAVCQIVAIPSNAKLQLFSWGISDDTSRKVFQFGALFDANSGTAVATLYAVNRNDKKWVARSFNLSKFAGQRDYVAFGVVGNSTHRGKAIGQYLDDVSITGGSTTPSPSPSPTPPVNCKPSTFPSSTPTPNTGPDQGWGPAAVAAGFYLPENYGYAGACENIAIVIESTVRTSDLSAYLSQFGISETGTVTNVSVDGGGALDGAGEATLDLETIAGLAPAANIYVYAAPDLSDTHIEDAYAKVLSDGKASVVNSSFGGCESSAFESATDSDAQSAAATGITFSASAGDQGAGCFNGSNTVFPQGANAPAADPHFVGVGGGQSTSAAGPYNCGDSAAAITNPVVWNDCVGAGGGGLSTTFTTPSYQVGVSGASQSHRNVPDIALPAAYDETYFKGAWGLVWGTSWASPIYVAMQAEIDEACGANWGINTLYNDFAAHAYFSFYDVTGGNNQNTGGSGSYSAATGFDNVSGIGMPGGQQLAQNLCSAPSARRAATLGNR